DQQLRSDKARLDSDASYVDRTNRYAVDSHNQRVRDYNSRVQDQARQSQAYNAEVQQLKRKIQDLTNSQNDYNRIVEAIQASIRQLQQQYQDHRAGVEDSRRQRSNWEARRDQLNLDLNRYRDNKNDFDQRWKAYQTKASSQPKTTPTTPGFGSISDQLSKAREDARKA